MEQQIKKQNAFYQSMVNQAKLGAYYTDPEHCRRINRMLEFPAGQEVCCLEPSIGDAKAAILVTGRKENPDVRIFGVELNADTAERARENPLVEDCIYGDFLTDAAISKGVFSFCFANPPYGDADGSRLETKFLGRILPCLSAMGALVFVAPYYVAAEEPFLSTWCAHLDTWGYYRFHEPEFGKWKQVVLFGRKKAGESLDREEMKAMEDILKAPERIPLLPETCSGTRLAILPSCGRDITEFRSREFDARKAWRAIKGSPLEKMVREKIRQEPFIADMLGRPPIMPNAGQMYLMAISGAGQGLVGSEENGDLHLQRGVVVNAEESVISQENGRMTEAVQKFSQIKFCLIENSGKISRL